MNWLLDTNVVSELTKEKPDAALQLISDLFFAMQGDYWLDWVENGAILAQP